MLLVAQTTVEKYKNIQKEKLTMTATALEISDTK